MKNLLQITAGLLLLTNLAFSQPTIQWQNSIGGNSLDQLYSLQQTSDGGYILGGRSGSNISGDKTENLIGGTFQDYWIIKTDAAGNIQWQNTIGGNDEDWLFSIYQTSDGGYILGGHSVSGVSGDKTETSYGGYDFWIVKTDGSGNIQWQNTIQGNFYDLLYTMRPTSDGGYILGGTSDSDISGDKTENNVGQEDYWIVKISSSGTIQWQNTIGGTAEDFLYSIEQTIDGGYILGGESKSNISGDKTENSKNGSYDYWIIKTDSVGNILWQNTIGGNSTDELRSIQQTSDGGYIMGGSSWSNISADKTENSNGQDDYWIIKTDASGNLQWQNTIGGSSTENLYSIEQTSDGGYILGGLSGSNISGDKTENSLGGYDYWVIKTNASGNIQWQNTIGGNFSDNLYSIQKTSDGGYILGGYSNSNISGDKTENCIGGDDYWIVKLAPDTITGITSLVVGGGQGIKLYPNPATHILTLSLDQQTTINSQLAITDITGRQILTQNIITTEQTINIQSFTSGVYVLKVVGDKNVWIGKFVKE